MYLTLALALWYFMDQASSLMLHGKALSAMEAVVEVLFKLYTQATITLTFDDVVIKYNYSIRGKYPEKFMLADRDRGPLNHFRGHRSY